MFFFRQLNEEKTRSSKSQEALQIGLQHTLKPTSDHLGPVTFSHGNRKTTAEILTTGCTKTQLYFLSGISIILSEKRFSSAHSPSQKNKAPVKRKLCDALKSLSSLHDFLFLLEFKTLLSQNITSGHLKSHQNKLFYLNKRHQETIP